VRSGLLAAAAILTSRSLRTLQEQMIIANAQTSSDLAAGRRRVARSFTAFRIPATIARISVCSGVAAGARSSGGRRNKNIQSQLGEPAVTKLELGTKRLCAHCGAKFYDRHHSPIACPKCSRVFEAVQASSRWRAGGRG
jgi:hypothetical protein